MLNIVDNKMKYLSSNSLFIVKTDLNEILSHESEPYEVAQASRIVL